MHGVESSTSAARRLPAVQRPSPVGEGTNTTERVLSAETQGAFAQTRMTLKKVLGTVGFVDVTGARNANFETYLQRKPVDLNMDDLKPGMLADVMAWVTQELAQNPDQALATQAHVRPEAALKLLT